jgi:hypothetical protein
MIQPTEQLPIEATDFHTGQVSAETEMAAKSESEVIGVASPQDVETMRLCENRFITRGGGV